MHRVVVTGMGALSPYGSGVELLQKGILSGKTSLSFSQTLGFVVGEISEEEADWKRWNTGKRREMSRATQLALLAAEEAINSAGISSLNHDDTLVNIGTGVADLQEISNTTRLIDNQQIRKISPYFVPKILNNIPAGYVAMKYGMMGGVESSSTACATGLHCIGNSFRAVRHGWVRRAVCGATEGCVNQMAIAGFDRMRALAHGNDPSISRPFDEKRCGFTLSEGAGILVLERLDDAIQRDANILAEVVGYGTSSDCHHISLPDPSGIGARLSMSRCLSDSSLSSSSISYINAHATSTPKGDSIEALAISQLFSNISISSIKGHIGHLLAAAGAVETIATICAIRDHVLPANLNLNKSDIEENNIRLLRENEDWKKDKRIAIVNSFGFGGTNASIIVSSI